MVDPGFPVGGCRAIGGRRPPTWALFGENVCENERIGSHWGGACASGAPLDSPIPLMNSINSVAALLVFIARNHTNTE